MQQVPRDKTVNFNPRSREGSDAKFVVWVVYDSVHFNPRSREGSDEETQKIFESANVISIHAPAKGATQRYDTHEAAIQDFNPRSREGSDGPATVNSFSENDFNPRSREGSDAAQLWTGPEDLQFQSTLPRRERLNTIFASKATY